MNVEPLPVRFEDHRPHSATPRVVIVRQADGELVAIVINLTRQEAAALVGRALAGILSPPERSRKVAGVAR